ncbi:MAG: zinc-binding dehydrogenase [Actinomycetota bacterium]
MQAFVVDAPGDPSVLTLRTVPDPEPEPGWVVIDVAAFGLNRAEAVTRAGGSGAAVPFPRIIGIECVGTVVDGGGTDLAPGRRVAAAMGGMGRGFDGSYAERTKVPRSNVFPVTTGLDWATFGALPETFFTAWGCLAATGFLTGAPRVLMRPGASALGLAVAQIVNDLGGEVIGVTRSDHKREALMTGGMADVVVTAGPVEAEVRDRWPEGATVAIDTVASNASVADDLALLAAGGTLCVAGSLADSYDTAASSGVAAAFEREDVTFYSSETLRAEVDTATLQQVVERVEAGVYRPGIAEVIAFGELPEAHTRMEANAYAGKVVVDLTS